MKRPFTVSIIGWLFIVVGLVNSGFHITRSPLDRWVVALSLLGIVATVGGVFLLKRCGWARWLVLAWLAFHVAVSAFHSLSETAAHLLMLIVVGYFLLRPPASKYFSSAQSQ